MSERITVNSLSAFMGKEIQSFFVLKSQKAGLNERAEWVNACFEDQTGSVDAVIWKEAIPPTIKQMVSRVVKVRGKVGIRQGNTQLQVKEMVLALEGEFDLSEFAPGLSSQQVDELRGRLEAIIASVREPKLNCLLRTAFSSGAVKAFASLPGGHTHHVYNGGLLVHTIEVANLTDSLILADEQDSRYHLQHIPVNRGIAITGALLHDIGKGKEFLPFPFNKRRENSYFVGFPTAGATLIDRYIEAIERVNPDAKYGQVRDILENIACSCHVTYKDCVPPRTKEAIFVRLADRVSADRDVIDTDLCEYMAEHPDETPGMIYSDYFRSYITVENGIQNKSEKTAKTEETERDQQKKGA